MTRLLARTPIWILTMTMVLAAVISLVADKLTEISAGLAGLTTFMAPFFALAVQ